MMDQRHVGHVFAPFDVLVEAGALRLYSKAIGETGPIPQEEGAARACPDDGLIAPLCYANAMALAGLNPNALNDLLAIDSSQVLHGEEQLENHAPIRIGDRITVQGTVTAVEAKRQAAFHLVTCTYTLHNQRAEQVCTVTRSLVIQNRAMGATA